MRTSQRGIKAIAVREGTVLKGYKDSKGLLTIGVGHLVKPGEPYTLGGKITQVESDRLLADDLRETENAINSLVKVPLQQNQFDALASFIFNIGVGGFKKSSVLRKLNQKDYVGAGNALMLWVKPPEITGRRRTEQKQFFTPYSGVVSPVAQIPTNDDIQEQPPINIETTQTTVESGGETSTATTTTATTSEPVTVKAVAMGLYTKLLAGIAALSALGVNAGTIIETKLSEITTNQLILLGFSAAVLIAVLWFWQKRKSGHDELTNALIGAAASKEHNTVVLEK